MSTIDLEPQSPKNLKDLILLILIDRWSIRIIIIFLALLATFTGLAVPYFQQKLTQSLSFYPLYVCTALALLSFLLTQLTNYLGQKEALTVQKKLALHLYKKILHLKSYSLKDKSIGEMVSFYTTDIPSSTMWLEQTLPYALTTAFPLIAAPIFLKYVYLIPYKITLFMIFVVIIVNIGLARRQSVFFSKFKSLAGERMGLVNEWIQNIKSLKALSWLSGFENKIIKKRIQETHNRIAMVTNGQMMNSISSSITFWLNLLLLVYISYFDQSLIKSFDLIAVFWVMGIFLAKPLRQLPWFFTMMFDAWTSIKRLAQFFELHNEKYIIKTNNDLIDQNLKTQNCYLKVKNLNLTLNKNPLLKSISFEINKSEIIGLIGPIGSGKSLLLKSLMLETPFIADDLDIKTFSYLPQEPFVLSANLKENIIFNYNDSDESNNNNSKNKDQNHNHLSDLKIQNQLLKSLDQAQFDLVKDRMTHGLKTEIGERGLNISGGQKQRLNLARLFYNPQDLFLLDDPFSAVDVKTEEKIIAVIEDLKKQGHSFLITTQRYHFLKKCDQILFLEKGEILFNGTYSELIKIKKFNSFISGLPDSQGSTHA